MFHSGGGGTLIVYDPAYECAAVGGPLFSQDLYIDISNSIVKDLNIVKFEHGFEPRTLAQGKLSPAPISSTQTCEHAKEVDIERMTL